MLSLNAITLDEVTDRSVARHTCRSKRMNATLPLMAKPHSWGNCARTE